MQTWFVEHLWITFFIIYAGLAFIYNKVFKVRRLPILKEAIIYLLLGVGAFILLLFQVDLELPIVISLGAAISLMVIVRIRYYFIDRSKRASSSTEKTSQAEKS
jgi:4-hydroxybenzoate polyprenyltransferase